MRTLTTYLVGGFFVVSGFLAGTSLAVAEPPLVVQLKGKAVGETRNIPPIQDTGTREGNCFEVDLIDVRNDKRLGTAMRCFTDVNAVQGGLALTETTFFRFPEGTLVARTRPTFQTLVDGAGEMTHLTGTVPVPFATNLLPEAGTAKFKGESGYMRYGGVANLSQFREKNEIVFNDIAIVHFVDTTAQIKHVQKRLQEAAFYTGTIDGVLGPNTTAALRQYQAKHGLPATGELDEATRKALGVQ